VATYDFAGRIKTVTDPDATFSRFEYEGLETTTYDRKGNKSYSQRTSSGGGEE